MVDGLSYGYICKFDVIYFQLRQQAQHAATLLLVWAAIRFAFPKKRRLYGRNANEFNPLEIVNNLRRGFTDFIKLYGVT